MALTLDEFALLLHLENVYWQEQGRVSVDAVIVTITVALLFLGGLQPFNAGRREPAGPARRLGHHLLVIVTVTLAVVCFLKGKLWTGRARLLRAARGDGRRGSPGRPGSPWFRHYATTPASTSAPSAATSAWRLGARRPARRSST